MNNTSKRFLRTAILAAILAVTSFATPVAHAAAPSTPATLGTFDLYATPWSVGDNNTLKLIILHDLAPAKPTWRLADTSYRDEFLSPDTLIAARLHTVVSGEPSARPVKGSAYRLKGSVVEETLCPSGGLRRRSCTKSTYLSVTDATKIPGSCVYGKLEDKNKKMYPLDTERPSISLSACATAAGVFAVSSGTNNTRDPKAPVFVSMEAFSLKTRNKGTIRLGAGRPVSVTLRQLVMIPLPASGGTCTVRLAGQADSLNDGKGLVPYTNEKYVFTFAC